MNLKWVVKPLTTFLQSNNIEFYLHFIDIRKQNRFSSWFIHSIYPLIRKNEKIPETFVNVS